MPDDPNSRKALLNRAGGSFGVAAAAIAGAIIIDIKYGTSGGWWVLVVCTVCVVAFATWTLIRGLIAKE